MKKIQLTLLQQLLDSDVIRSLPIGVAILDQSLCLRMSNPAWLEIVLPSSNGFDLPPMPLGDLSLAVEQAYRPLIEKAVSNGGPVRTLVSVGQRQWDVILTSLNLEGEDQVFLNLVSEIPLTDTVGDFLPETEEPLSRILKAAKTGIWDWNLFTGQPVHVFGGEGHSASDQSINYVRQAQLALFHLITTISSSFANLPVEEIESGIRRSIGHLGEFSQVDRCYVFLFSEDGQWMDYAYEWCAEGIAPQQEQLPRVAVQDFAWSNGIILRNEVLYIRRVHSIPVEAAAEREEFIRQGNQSMLVVPMVFQERVVGFLGFDSVSAEKEWPEEQITLVKIIGEILVSALERKKAQASLQDYQRTLENKVEERTAELERRQQVAASLRDTLKVLNSNKPLEDVLDYICDQARELLGANATMIRHGDLHNKLVRTIASSHLPADMDVIKVTPLYMGENDQILLSNQPVIEADLQQSMGVMLQDPEINAQLDEVTRAGFQATIKHFRSLIKVPLFTRTGIFGSLTFLFDVPRQFSQDEVQLTLTLGDQLSLAIENARLHREEQTRRHEAERRRVLAESLREIVRTINSNRPFSEVLDFIVCQSRELLSASSTMIRRIDYDRNMVYTVASCELPEEFSVIRETPYFYSQNQTPLDQHQPSYSSDLHGMLKGYFEHPELHSEKQMAWARAILNHYQSQMVAPLFIRERLYGTLTFYFAAQREFSQEDVDLAGALGDQVALAIENANLYAQEQARRVEAERRRNVAEALRDILTVLNSNRPLDEILSHIVTQAGRLLETDAVAIHRLHESGKYLEIQAARGLDEDYVQFMRVPVGKGAAGKAVRSHQPVIVEDSRMMLAEMGPDIMGPDQWQMLLNLTNQFASILSVPLAVKENFYGAISLYFVTPRQFSDEDIRLAVAFADQAALAVETARLRDQAEQAAAIAERNRLARDLHDAVTQTLFSASLIAEVLPRIWERNAQDGLHRLEELRQLTRGALAEMRTLLYELRPTTLMEADLGDLLKQLCEAFIGRARVPVEYTSEGKTTLPADVQIAFYRIAQEALNNVSKYAAATQVQFTLTRTPEEVQLCIVDNGRGFVPQKVTAEHFGLKIMRERAEAIGAFFDLESALGKGTRITVHWEPNEGMKHG